MEYSILKKNDKRNPALSILERDFCFN